MEGVQRLLDRLAELRSRDVHLVGVRHHSPACAHHLQRLIERIRPGWVLVEGPAELTALVPLMAHPQAVAPFAAYCAHAAKGSFQAAYYPFCDYSPELVAIRRGLAVGADVRFVDLSFPEICKREVRPSTGRRRLWSLMREAHLARSAYLAALARKTGCRDQDELWDHLFEAGDPERDPDAFFDEVAAYCEMARRDHSDEVLEADGSLARERRMSAALGQVMAAQEASEAARPVVVVTGGFHTPAIAQMARRPPKFPSRIPPAAAPVLMRYGFVQLDALNGYASGMRSPAFYDATWRALQAGEGQPRLRAAAQLLVDVAREGRRGGEVMVQAADETVALAQAARLAELRGHAGPTREDLQDALTSTLAKGAADVEGRLVDAVVRRVLTGHAVGQVPAEAGLPPIVQSFHDRTAALKITAGPAPREVTLQLYQRAEHRAASRFLHATRFLEVPYASWLAGPDYAAGEEVERRQERWRLSWTPDVEQALIEASVYGATVEDAAVARLEEAVAGLMAEGHGRDSGRAVQLLLTAFVMGAAEADALIDVVRDTLSTDPKIERVVGALGSLVVCLQGREPLEIFRVDAVRSLVQRAFDRTLRLLPDAARAPRARVDAVAQALLSLRPLAATEAVELGLERLADRVDAAAGAAEGDPRILGILAGLAYGFGRRSAEQLSDQIRGHLMGTGGDPSARVALLVGVLAAAREVAWRVPAVIDGLSALFERWDETAFFAALPELRLAFSHLTPKEIDRVAHLVAAPADAPEAPAALGAAAGIDEMVRRALEQDGLLDWGGP